MRKHSCKSCGRLSNFKDLFAGPLRDSGTFKHKMLLGLSRPANKRRHSACGHSAASVRKHSRKPCVTSKADRAHATHSSSNMGRQQSQALENPRKPASAWQSRKAQRSKLTWLRRRPVQEACGLIVPSGLAKVQRSILTDQPRKARS